MTLVEHALIYLDLPKEMQDDDAAEFARTVRSLWDLLNRRRDAIRAAIEAWDNAPMDVPGMVGAMTPIMATFRGMEKKLPDETGGPVRYYVEHGTIHDRKTGKHVAQQEAAEMLSAVPALLEAAIAWRRAGCPHGPTTAEDDALIVAIDALLVPDDAGGMQ